jgi:hypothetical protein
MMQCIRRRSLVDCYGRFRANVLLTLSKQNNSSLLKMEEGLHEKDICIWPEFLRAKLN